MAGASVTTTAELLGVSRATVSRTTTELKKHGKTSSNRSNPGRDRLILQRFVGGKHPSTAAKATAELNQYSNSPISTYKPDCFLPAVKHGGGPVVVWAAMSRNYLGVIVARRGRINSKDIFEHFGRSCSSNCPGICP